MEEVYGFRKNILRNKTCFVQKTECHSSWPILLFWCLYTWWFQTFLKVKYFASPWNFVLTAFWVWNRIRLLFFACIRNNVLVHCSKTKFIFVILFHFRATNWSVYSLGTHIFSTILKYFFTLFAQKLLRNPPLLKVTV